MTEDEEAVVSMRWYGLDADECIRCVAAMAASGRSSQTTINEWHARSKVFPLNQHSKRVTEQLEKMRTEGLITTGEMWRGKPDMLWIAEHGTPKGGLRFDAGPDGFTVERNE